MSSERTIFEAEHEYFRESVRKFMQREIGPYSEQWREQGSVDREAYLKAGQQGYLLMWAEEEFGGSAVRDLRYDQILQEENIRHGDVCFYQNLHSMVVAPYLDKFASPEQKKRFLPKAITGEHVLAIAMTEPDAGSDLANMRTTAVDCGDYWELTGSKTFISNGHLSDLVIVAARTSLEKKHSIGLFIVERDMPGFERGKRLKKLGLDGQDTAELFFDKVKIPKENVLGDPTKGFTYLTECLAVERLQAAIGSIAMAQVAFDLTLDYIKNRRAFGKALGALQHIRFVMANLKSELDIVQSYVDQCVILGNQGTLTAEQSSIAKLRASELEGKVIDQCLQFHGGAGYMHEYKISQMYKDARVSRIYAGANEIMLEIISRKLGLDERKMN